MPIKPLSELGSPKGTFEYIEAKIRRDAEGTSFGGDFEWLCQWFLENAPRYRGQFDKVWLWKDWPERWGTDAGIDIVARTRAGELWAIQAKADHPDRAITKREIDSFLSESNRPEFAYRLLMATTDDIGANARRTRPFTLSYSERNGASHRCRGVDVLRQKPAASAVPLTHLPEDTRGILSNCACLGEGGDVPVLDGVALIDPKRSMVDIIQAVGRVIRKAAGKSAEGGARS